MSYGVRWSGRRSPIRQLRVRLTGSHPADDKHFRAPRLSDARSASLDTAQGGAGRKLATSLQRRAPACIAEIPAAGPGGVRASLLRLAGCARLTSSAGQATRGGAAHRALTLPLDHLVGADQWPCPTNSKLSSCCVFWAFFFHSIRHQYVPNVGPRA